MRESEIGIENRPVRIRPRPDRRRTINPGLLPSIPLRRRIFPEREITPPHPNQPEHPLRRKAA